VPIEVFLDGGGNPVFQPSHWQKYKTGYRHRSGWIRHGREGRAVPPDPTAVRAKIIGEEQRKEEELRRLEDSPSCFTSFRGKAPKGEKEIMSLFRKYPRIVQSGRDGEILSVRTTKTKGIVLDLEFDNGDRGLIRSKIYSADVLLNEGGIVLDHDRGTWVVINQARRPEFALSNVGIDPK
jgi:hypothetical protein